MRGYTHYREITCLSQSPSIHKDRRKAIEILRSADSPILGAVTDIRFGELQAGWEVARIAREIDSDIPIVYISGHGAVDWPKEVCRTSIMIESLDAGFTEILTEKGFRRGD
ncbi:hypothetical protein [Sinorhizobium medicae]